MPLRKDVDVKYYRQVEQAMHARDGETLNIQINLKHRGRIVLGKLDDSYDDTAYGSKLGLTSHVHYLGPRYNRNFVHHFSVATSASNPSPLHFT